MAARVAVLEGHLSPKTPHRAELIATVRRVLAPGKGILAIDQGAAGAVLKAFGPMGVENTPENRRRYRSMMLGTPGLAEFVGGVILHDETFWQAHDDGRPFPDVLRAAGIVPGIKTDGGLEPLQGGLPGEQQTPGLDGYAERAAKYYAAGARFCKWRNVCKIQGGTVSECSVRHTAETLARYAKLSQDAGLAPIVEPEVMIDGEHDIATCQAVSERVYAEVVRALHAHGVLLEGMMLKPNMIVPGASSGATAAPAEVAAATIAALARTLPAAVPGVCFLSGGLSERQASAYLSAMNSAAGAYGPRPWTLTFSFARALQSSALQAWGGRDENTAAARAVLLHRARMNSLAARGRYDAAADDVGRKGDGSLYVKDNAY